MLERARSLVDTSNNWSKNTLKTYKSKFNILRDFERDLHVRVMPHLPPGHPPNGPAIRLMWAQERYSLYPADWSKRKVLGEEAIKFGTIRALHSAASHFWTLDLLQTHSDQLTFGFKDRPQLWYKRVARRIKLRTPISLKVCAAASAITPNHRLF
jgi:hypothetical protein